MFNPRFLVILGLIVLAALSRFLPFPPNVAAVAAVALFGGAYFADKRLAFIIPLAVMLLTDLIIGLHSTLLFVYAAFGLIVGIGFLLRDKISFKTVPFAAIGGSLAFFIITNFGVWLMSAYYPLTLGGLVACYTAAIPFFHYTLLGDLFFVSVLFGSFELAKRSFPALQSA